MKNTRRNRHFLALGVTFLSTASGCSSSGESGTGGNGGQASIGGVPSTGGTASSLGGGSKTGGASTAGGGSGTRANSGTGAAGGSSTATSSVTGGVGNSGGSKPVGGSSKGGTSSTGGARATTGGASAKGGTSGIGGRTGSTAGGSSSATGGKMGAGGTGNASTGGQSSTSAEAAPSAITGLKVEANPNNVLSAYVSWTTDTAADSTVQFGQGKYEWEISDTAKVTTHKVLIIGMNASKAYQIKAISTNGGGSVNGTTTFTTTALPSVVPIAKVPVNDSTKVQPGWTLMNIIKASSSAAPVSSDPAMAVMYDTSGQPVWYYIDGTTDDFGGAISTYLTDKGVLIGPVMSNNGTGESPREVDFAGNTIWECKDPRCGGTGDLTHDTVKLPNGNHVVLRWKELGSGTNIDSDPIFEEIDASGNVVWSLDYGALVPKPTGITGDWCHGNSITVDIEKDTVYANCRFMGLIKTSYKNPGSLIWFLPASYGKATGTMTFSPTTSQYSDTHDPEIHDDGTILIFDNGGYSSSMFPGTGTTYHSRAVEYKIDEAKKTATLAWEFPGTFSVDAWYKNTWYNSYYGDADRLANGNVLITAGSVSANNGDARVFEVTKADGKVVWEFRLDAGYGVYRAERITPPLVKAISQ